MTATNDPTPFSPTTLDALASYAALGLPLTPAQIRTLRRGSAELRRLAGELAALRGEVDREIERRGRPVGVMDGGECEADRLIEAYQAAKF